MTQAALLLVSVAVLFGIPSVFGQIPCEWNYSFEICHNGGTCQDYGDSVTMCKCPPAWTGWYCETPTDPNAPTTIKPTTTTRLSTAIFPTTTTKQNTAITRTSTIKQSTPVIGGPIPCEWNYSFEICHNGGTCKDYGDSVTICTCPPAWTGWYCETPTDPRASTTIKPTTTAKPGGNSSNCFPEDATVELEDGSFLALGLLQPGQHVRTVTSEGSTRYSTVLAFLDRKDGLFDFVRLHTHQGHLDVSDKHLVAIVSASKRLFVQAEQVRTGDLLVAGNGSVLPVTSVSRRRARGAYAPLTMDGTLLVMDTLCSCYAVTTSHTLGDLVMIPLKLWHSLFGVQHWQQTTAGIHWYAEMLSHVASTVGIISV